MLDKLKYIKIYWKEIFIVAYAIFIPLYFFQSTQSTQKALDASRTSSSNQISYLEDRLDEQAFYYDQLIEEYQIKIDLIEQKYNGEIDRIKERQAIQQEELTIIFKKNPSAISEELRKRYGLK